MTTWTQAVELNAKANGGAAAIKYTNREASGVIGQMRSVLRTFGKAPSVALTPWDWYAFALPALGWTKPGDKFRIDTAHQLQVYPYSKQLYASLVTMAKELDEGGATGTPPVDARGTDKGFRQLAADAWQAMKTLGAEASNLPDAMREQWSAQLGPKGGAAVAASASSAAAAAAKPPAGSVPEPEQLPLPGVPQVLPPPGTQPTYEAQPVGDGTKVNGGGGGVGLLLLAAAFVFGKKKKGKR